MRRLSVVCIALLLAGCGSAASPALRGEPEVYERISASSSCPDLQAIFDRANTDRAAAIARDNDDLAGITLSYMNASYGRMVTLSCPGQ